MRQAAALQKAIALLVPALLFGFLVTAQWITFSGPSARDVEIRYIQPLAATVADLQTKQSDLKGQIAGLRDQLDAAQKRGASQVGLASDVRARVAELQASAGLTSLSGEGLIATLDVPRPQAGSVAVAERPPCLAPDLTDVINAAWHAGARAVAVGPERIVASSSVYCVGATIVINGSIVEAPYEVRILGDPQRLLGRFDDPAELRDLKRRRDERNVVFEVAGLPAVTIPAYTGAISTGTARPR